MYFIYLSRWMATLEVIEETLYFITTLQASSLVNTVDKNRKMPTLAKVPRLRVSLTSPQIFTGRRSQWLIQWGAWMTLTQFDPLSKWCGKSTASAFGVLEGLFLSTSKNLWRRELMLQCIGIGCAWLCKFYNSSLQSPFLWTQIL